MKSQMKSADRSGALVALIVGPDGAGGGYGRPCARCAGDGEQRTVPPGRAWSAESVAAVGRPATRPIRPPTVSDGPLTAVPPRKDHP